MVTVNNGGLSFVSVNSALMKGAYLKDQNLLSGPQRSNNYKYTFLWITC